MSTQTFISFVVPTANTDGSLITEALTYKLLIDTVNPPVKSFVVPTANIAAAVAGVVTVKFTDIGFVPVKGQDYFASSVATDTDGSSALADVVSFAYSVVPNAPTGLKGG